MKISWLYQKPSDLYTVFKEAIELWKSFVHNVLIGLNTMDRECKGEPVIVSLDLTDEASTEHQNVFSR